ncbi:MAG: CRISPR-associated protein Cas5 [Sphingomonadales bacterium]|nr:CRISPR-associated protein Cas5 [Sphingomonadales bacterium]
MPSLACWRRPTTSADRPTFRLMPSTKRPDVGTVVCLCQADSRPDRCA